MFGEGGDGVDGVFSWWWRDRVVLKVVRPTMADFVVVLMVMRLFDNAYWW